jgi:hypothetical protein
MVKANFFKAIATGLILLRVLRYIGNQQRLVEAYVYNIRELRLLGFSGGELKFNLLFDVENRSGAAIKAGLFDFDCFIDGIRVGRAVSNDFIDIQPYSISPVSFDIRVRPKDLGALGQKLLDAVGNFGGINVRLVGQFSIETLPGVYKNVPVDFTDTAQNLLFNE